MGSPIVVVLRILHRRRNSLCRGGDGQSPPGGFTVGLAGSRHRWDRGYSDRKEEFSVLMNADETLYRNTCSAILDAQFYPHLSTTPYWLRFLSGLLPISARQRLISSMLWVQIQSMNHAHKYYAWHGKLQITNCFWWLTFWWMGIWVRDPPVLRRIEWYSADWLSRLTQGTCFWAGKFLLGMKGQYPEYTPRRDETKGLNNLDISKKA
jgi:hypothetical protein